jgi:flagellar biosynthetic protein FlhB
MADADKQFPATPRKKQEARQKGQVARSMEINSAIILLGALVTLRFVGPDMFNGLAQIMVAILSNCNYELTTTAVVAFTPVLILAFAKLIAPILLVCLVLGVSANLLQFGFLFTGEPLIPRLSKISPAKGFARIFSMRTAVELVKSVLKIVIVGFVAYLTLKGEAGKVLSFVDMETIQIFRHVSGVVYTLFFRICMVLLFLALLDYLYQRWDHSRELKMSRQEMKDELKRSEGDPLIRQRIRSIQRQLSHQRMMTEVPKADVIITNPTELAIAIRYDSQAKNAPYVVAKGARLVAQRIRELAQEHSIPIVENKPLAQLLFKSVEVGGEVPAKFYRAVAEILAYVYRLKGKVK